VSGKIQFGTPESRGFPSHKSHLTKYTNILTFPLWEKASILVCVGQPSTSHYQ
jgi:hypothetical protein